MKKSEKRTIDHIALSNLHQQITIGILSARQQDFFELAIRSYQASLLNSAQLIVEPADAAEIVQEAFCRAWKFRSSFCGHSNYYTWLYRIMLNLAKTHYQYQHSDRNIFNSSTINISGVDSAKLCLYDPAPAAADLLDRYYLARRVQAAVMLLPKKLRTVVYLYYFAGMRYNVIAR